MWNVKYYAKVWLMMIIIIIFGHMLPLKFPVSKKKISVLQELHLLSYMSTEGKGSRD